MESMLEAIFALLQVTLIDVVLSGDNMGVIALAVRNLPKEQARMANLIGVTGAICMRILFAAIITTLLMIHWLPIRLVGGLLLLKITWNLLCIKESENMGGYRGNKGFWIAVYNIIMADMSMSLDNVIAIGGIAQGNIVIIAFGLLLNVPIIFFGSQLIGEAIKKHKITIYIGSGILAHTALNMILSDRLIATHISSSFSRVFPWIIAIAIMVYGALTYKDSSKGRVNI